MVLSPIATLLVALIAFSSASYATDFGTLGKTYDVAERDLVDEIKEKLRKKQESGELDQLNQAMVGSAKNYVHRPPGLSLPRAIEHKVSMLDPVYTLERDITDADGRLLFTKGTQVNPLRVKPLTKTLCFIDGDDEKQVEWMTKFCASDQKNKLILVKGDFVGLAEKTKLRLYFDQRGYLTKRFDLKALPSVVRQSGYALYIEEFPPI